MAMTYTKTQTSFRWCPIVNCQYGVDVVDNIAQAIECKCGWMYCFKCGLEDHRPCTCNVAEEWIKNKESKETLLYNKWLLANTKDCPRCQTPIEKSRGCNHMKCLNDGCGYEFCWQCLESWETHIGIEAYGCGRYATMDRQLRQEINDMNEVYKKNLARSCAYYEHYKRCEDQLANIEKFIKAFRLENDRIKGVSKDRDFLLNVFQTLEKIQRLRKWSYAYAFYIKNEVGDEGQCLVCETFQEQLSHHSAQLQEKLQELCSKKAKYSDYVESRDAIQSFELNCKLISATFLDKIQEIEEKLCVRPQTPKIVFEKEESQKKTLLFNIFGFISGMIILIAFLLGTQ